MCETAERIKEGTIEFLQNVDWGKVGIATVATAAAIGVSMATGGAEVPVVSGIVGKLGVTGLVGTVLSGAGIGALSGAAGGGTYALTSGVLSEKPVDQIGADVGNGILGGAVAGGLTGGLLGGLSTLTSKVTNPVTQYVTNTVGETAVDTVADAVQGGNITVEGITTNFLINTVVDGVSNKVTGSKSKVYTNKLSARDVPVTKSRKDVTPVQQLALPGPDSQSLALPAPNATPKTDFYVGLDGTTIPATGYRYMNSNYAEQTMKTMQAPGGYIGFSKFDSAKQARDAYQISTDWSDAKLRGEFDTLQIMDNARVPRAYGDAVDEMLEPITKAYPEFGTGGYPPLITDKFQNIKFKDLTIIGD